MILPNTSCASIFLYLSDRVVVASQSLSVFTSFIDILMVACFCFCIALVLNWNSCSAGKAFTPTLLKLLYFHVSNDVPWSALLYCTATSLILPSVLSAFHSYLNLSFEKVITFLSIVIAC